MRKNIFALFLVTFLYAEAFCQLANGDYKAQVALLDSSTLEGYIMVSNFAGHVDAYQEKVKFVLTEKYKALKTERKDITTYEPKDLLGYILTDGSRRFQSCTYIYKNGAKPVNYFLERKVAGKINLFNVVHENSDSKSVFERVNSPTGSAMPENITPAVSKTKRTECSFINKPILEEMISDNPEILKKYKDKAYHNQDYVGAEVKGKINNLLAGIPESKTVLPINLNLTKLIEDYNQQ